MLLKGKLKMLHRADVLMLQREKSASGFPIYSQQGKHLGPKVHLFRAKCC